ncbi:MAG TPA: type VI secretion system membrane subunit TssM [Limnobacter sp.]|nr:type VI secretion system membrane subunit TssM [Limnobacter sp.]
MLIRFLLSLLAYAMLAGLVIWLAPLLQIGESRPLDPWWTRLVVLVALALLIFGPQAWRWWRMRNAERALKTSLTRQEELGQAQAAKLQDIFNQAISTLKAHQRKSAWYKSKPGLYELPWYVFIGPPGSGKTTALRNAGLRFPLQQQLGKDVVQGVGGTRNCDWWFSDQAVLIDTAGRFTTQDADQHTDAVAWSSFLGLLKKHRPKQPLNGVLLTLSVQDLLSPPAKRQALAMTIHARLQELVKALGVCPPVYLLITKVDWLEGFKESFLYLNEEERAQAWGVNLPHPNQLQDVLTHTLPQQLIGLEQHLLKRLEDQLQHEPQARQRARLLEFPHAFGQLRPALLNILGMVFQGDGPFDKPVSLRGVYFSSGTQDGTVFDRILSSFTTPQPSVAGMPNASDGKSFFIRDMLMKVIFPEQHLVGHAPKRARLEMLAYWGTLAVGGVGALAIAIGWWISHGNNQHLLDTVDQAMPGLYAQVEQIPTQTSANIEPLFVSLDALLEVVPPNIGEASHHLGLNQHATLAQAQRLAYRHALQTTLMPQVAKRLEEQLRQNLARDPELAYESLKAYLMLYEPARYDAETLSPWVVFDWTNSVFVGFAPSTQTHAANHLDSAIRLGAPSEMPARDEQLIAQARRMIGQLTLDQRLHQRMVRFYPADAHPAFNVLDVSGPSAAAVFSRPSGRDLQTGVPAFYTRAAYYGYYLPGLPQQAKQLQEEQSWVLGTDTTGRSQQTQSLTDLMRKARLRYIEEYITTWDAFLQDIQVQAPPNYAAAVNLAKLLASPQSPLQQLLKAVSSNTSLAGAAPALTDLAEKQANQQLARALPSSMALLNGNTSAPVQLEAPLEQRVDTYFQDLNQLFATNAPGYAQVSGLLNQLYAQLAAVQAAKNSKGPPPPAENFNTIQMNAGLLPEPVQGIVTQLAGQGSAQGRAAERANLSADLRPLEEVCQRTVANRYPVQAKAGSDILLEDFARFFGPGGLMDQFYQSRLASLVDTGKQPWQFKPSSDGSQSPPASALLQFQRAQRIRDVFFGANPNGPAFDIEMRLVHASSKNDVFYLDNNGKMLMFSVQHEPRHRIRWGGQLPSDTLSIRASEGQAKTFKGPWALFRLFEIAQVQASDRPELVRASITLEGRKFDFELMANSAFNPLTLAELRQFRCPSGL